MVACTRLTVFRQRQICWYQGWYYYSSIENKEAEEKKYRRFYDNRISLLFVNTFGALEKQTASLLLLPLLTWSQIVAKVLLAYSTCNSWCLFFNVVVTFCSCGDIYMVPGHTSCIRKVYSRLLLQLIRMCAKLTLFAKLFRKWQGVLHFVSDLRSTPRNYEWSNHWRRRRSSLD